MAGLLLPGVLLLAALCGIGETADLCRFNTSDQLWSCVSTIMSQKSDKLDALIDAKSPNVNFSRRNVANDHSLQFSFINILIKHASSIQLRDPWYNIVFPSNSTPLYLEFRCYWQPHITVTMDVKFELCNPSLAGEGCHNFDAHVNITLPSAEFRKDWIKGERRSGNMELKEADINLDVIATSIVNIPEWLQLEYEIGYDVSSLLGRLMSDLRDMLDRWFDNDVFPRFSKELAG